MAILNELEKIYPKLPRQERKVALLLLQDPKKAQQMSITALSKLAKVSPATITRLVKRLECKNFYELKLRLVPTTGAEPTLKKSAQTLAQQVEHFYAEVLTKTCERLDEATLKASVEALSNCRRVYVFGLGSSGYTANEVAQRLLRMGIAAFGMTESHKMYISSEIMEKTDVILVLSATGNTDEVNRAVALGQKKGAKIIALTGIEASPLAKLSDLVILVKNSNFVDNARFINSQFALMYVIDILTTMLLAKPRYHEKMDQTIASISELKFAKH